MSPRTQTAAVCVLSIAVLWALGMVGEELLNVTHAHLPGEDADNVPAVTSLVIKNYPLNAGHFVFSLTPLMIVFAGLAALRRPTRKRQSQFWYVFVSVWLLAVLYFFLFVLALLLPFHILMDEAGCTVVWKAVVAIDVLLVVALVALCVWKHLERRNSD